MQQRFLLALGSVTPAAAPAAASGHDYVTDRDNKSNTHDLVMEIVFPISGFIVLCAVFILLGLRYKSSKKRQQSLQGRSGRDEVMLESLAPGLPPRLTYAEMYKATNGFEKKLGAGGYGMVYEGVLHTGKKVAVKVFLDTSSAACRKGFCAEVLSIGSKKHRNLVQLCGFCVEDDHRMLVYELMANGSLSKVLFKRKSEPSGCDAAAADDDDDGDGGGGGGGGDDDKRHSSTERELFLTWERRKAIAIDTAQALAFLHDGSEENSIIHCDVKPENILLNERWEAKVSDFGLAKLMWAGAGGGARSHHEGGEGGGGGGGEDEAHAEGQHASSGRDASKRTTTTTSSSSSWFPSEITCTKGGVRGTLGYLAPEWIAAAEGRPAHITVASDVYSFGIVLLELVAGRRCMVPGRPFLPGIAFDLLAHEHDLITLLDPRLATNNPTLDHSSVRMMVRLALWCLQEDVTLRPTMPEVVTMLTTSNFVIPQPPFCDYFAGSSHFFDEDDIDPIVTSNMSSSHANSDSNTSLLSGSWQISIISGR